MNDYIADVFGQGGYFARSYPGYEQRDGQVALARIIDAAMSNNQHALCEAPCGTGKGIAYSVPAIYHAINHGKKVVIATANIALQEQLVEKDLPALRAVLPWSFTYTLLKGRNNYLCRDQREQSEGVAFSHELVTEIRQLNHWADRTKTGDKSELNFVPNHAAWSRYSVMSSECKRKECSFYKDCFYEMAKAAAHEANIIVTNYHLLFAHLQTRKKLGQDVVLPQIDLLVLDEAHEMADVARDFFGFSVSKRTVDRLGNAAGELHQPGLGQAIFNESNVVFSELKQRSQTEADKIRLKTPLKTAGKLIVALRDLARIANDILESPDVAARFAGSQDVLGMARQATNAEDVADSLEEVTTLEDKNKVYTIELDAKEQPKVASKLISVAPLLNTELFKQIPSVSLVSATMTAKGTFKFMRREVGIPKDSLEIIAPSPFDFGKQALLVIPKGLPDVNNEDYGLSVAKVMQRVIDICNGRTLCLFTSYKNLNIAYEYIAKACRGRFKVLKQGDLPRTTLAAMFKEDTHSVLLGTESFWTGIDVPGDALTAVVIDKFPFQNMSDPVIDAIKDNDPDNWFWQHYVPRAVIKLRQGAGRLIRSQRDVGVCVIPDPRGYKKSYGEDFLDSLPFTQVRERLEDIAKFLKTPLPPASERKVVQVSTAPAPVVIPPRVVSVPPASSPLLARLKAMAPPPPAAPPAPLSESPIAARLKEMKKP